MLLLASGAALVIDYMYIIFRLCQCQCHYCVIRHRSVLYVLCVVVLLCYVLSFVVHSRWDVTDITQRSKRRLFTFLLYFYHHSALT